MLSDIVVLEYEEPPTLGHAEEWVIIPDFPNYAISNFGRVFNIKREYFVSIHLNKYTGYVHVSLWNNGYQRTCSIHRLVACAFLGLPNSPMDVNHIDGDKTYNVLENLEWSSRGDNHRHAYRTGIRESVRSNMKAIRCIELEEEFESISECARELNTLPGSIGNCLAGRRKSINGLTFEYID